VDRHRPLLEQRIQAATVWNTNDFLAYREHFKGTQRNEISERKNA
jgi:hypothetical protein